MTATATASAPATPAASSRAATAGTTTPNISPRAAEICGNDIDDNCNDHVDEGCQTCGNDGECTGGGEACINGVCNLCETGCNAQNCRFDNPMMGGAPIAGRCHGFGNGCSACVPTCDADGDGFCPGPPANGLPGNDCDDTRRGVRPNTAEVCGNNLDDDCNGFADDNCESCDGRRRLRQGRPVLQPRRLQRLPQGLRARRQPAATARP